MANQKSDLEQAELSIKAAKRSIRAAIKQGKDVDGHLERLQGDLERGLDVLDCLLNDSPVFSLNIEEPKNAN